MLGPGAYFDQRAGVVLGQFRQTNVYPSVEAPRFSQHGGTVAPGYALTMTQDNGNAGFIFYTLDGSDPRLPGGARSPGAIRYTGPVTIDRSTVVKARVQNIFNGQWSALNEAVFATNASALRITEVNYNPHPGGAPFTDADEFEFVEVKNISAGTLNLKDVQFSAGIEFKFPDVSLAAGESGVVVRNVAAFQWRYGNSARVLGSYGGSASDNLSNGGETLALADAAGGAILSFTYDDDPATWHASTDGQGRSLTVVDPTVAPGTAWSLAGHWRPSRTLGGTPGADEPAAAGVVVTGAAFDHTALPHKLRFTFDRDVNGSFTAGDVTVRNLATGETVAPSGFSYDGSTRTATLTFSGALPNGDWRAAIPASATSDGGAGPLPREFVLSFFTLTGDVNRDRIVDSSDFALLAGNFGRTGTSYAQGNLNGDGSTDATDFAMLAGNFGRTLPAPPPAALLAEATAAAVNPAPAAVTAPAPAAPAPAPAQQRTAPPRRRTVPTRAAPAARPASPVRRRIT